MDTAGTTGQGKGFVGASANAEASLFFTKNTVSVYVRHTKKCPKGKHGRNYRRCYCPKWLYIYEGGGPSSAKLRSAKTRSWEKAETRAQEVRDNWDPEKRELKQLRSQKERSQVRLEEAVALYHADMVSRVGDNGTVAMSRSLLGHIDPERKAILRDGHMFRWLSKYNAAMREDTKIRHIDDLTPPHLTAWRSTWAFNDLTKAQRWTMVKQFFNFCERQGWIVDSPARKLRQFDVAKGNRTAVFSDQQYDAILNAIPLYDPENVPDETKRAWQRRLQVFTELLRWSGMALADAVQFKPELVDGDGVLRYRRHKTNELAIVPLPRHLIAMLWDVPLERYSIGSAQPFRTKDIKLGSDVHKWEFRYDQVFRLAGLAEVRTEHGKTRKPHPHMFRDTFAVWYLSNGTRLRTVSKMLGHAKTETTERAYLPWVRELHDAHIEDARGVQKNIAQVIARRKWTEHKIVSIAAGKNV